MPQHFVHEIIKEQLYCAYKIDQNFKEKRTNLFHYAFAGVLLNFCHNFI